MPAADRPRRTNARHQPYTKRSDDHQKNEYGECPTQATLQSRYFYASPCANNPNPILNTPHPCSTTPPIRPRPINSLIFNPAKWVAVPKPRDWIGPWPPTSATQLMTTDIDARHLTTRSYNALTKRNGEVLKNACLGKYCWQTTSWGPSGDIFCVEDFNNTPCDHTIAEWLTGCSDWSSRFEIRATPGMGYGLFSKVLWRAGQILGPYLGELVPSKAPQSQYVHCVHIGPNFAKQGNAPLAYIDSEEVGSFTRFTNHGCEFNALIEEARVGEERVLAMRARRDISAGEEVRIDYGDEHFGEGRWCCCGAGECRYNEKKMRLV